MVTYVRVRVIKPGQFQNAINFLRSYKDFIATEFKIDVNFGTEVGRLGTVVAITQFDNAQAWEDALDTLRSNPKYVQFIDQSAAIFEADIEEHLVTDLPL